jgi:hypothetical protein
MSTAVVRAFAVRATGLLDEPPFLRKCGQQGSVEGECAAQTWELELAEPETAFKIPDRNLLFLSVLSPTEYQTLAVHGAVAPRPQVY